MLETKYIVAILVIIFMLVCIWHYKKCYTTEALHCTCARRDAAMAAWGSSKEGTPPCDERFRGQMPFKHPRVACSRPTFNPYWAPFGSANAFATGATSQFIDVPISRMVGDHVPLE